MRGKLKDLLDFDQPLESAEPAITAAEELFDHFPLRAPSSMVHHSPNRQLA